MIDFACPRCRKPIRAPLAHAGREAPCPGCGRWVVVPAPPEGPGWLWRALAFAGALCLGAGALTVGYFWRLFRTTVDTGPFGPVHNAGLMQERQLGLIVGVGVALAGVLLVGAAAVVASRGGRG